MGVEEDVDVIASDSSAAVLRCVDNTVNHHLGTVGNYPRVNGNGVAGRGHCAGAGMASPALGAGILYSLYKRKQSIAAFLLSMLFGGGICGVYLFVLR